MDGVVKLFSNENDSHAREKMMNDKMWAKDLAYDESHLILFFSRKKLKTIKFGEESVIIYCHRLSYWLRQKKKKRNETLF
jgi:hypothetical protein